MKYALRDYVEADPRWGSRGHVAWAHAVVAPYSSFSENFTAPDCPRWMVHGRDDLPDLADRLVENAREASQGRRAPDHQDFELISEILHGRGFTGYDRNAEAAERQSEADRLTAEQAALLQVTRLLNRIEVRGGAHRAAPADPDRASRDRGERVRAREWRQRAQRMRVRLDLPIQGGRSARAHRAALRDDLTKLHEEMSAAPRAVVGTFPIIR